VIQYSETFVMDSRSLGVLDPPPTCLVPGDWMDGIGVERGIRYIEERLRSWT
jgi:hypothetical protein